MPSTPLSAGMAGRIRLVDTAGIRRPGRVARAGARSRRSASCLRGARWRGPTWRCSSWTPTGAVTRQDAVIAGEAERAGCGVVIAANKWDLVQGPRAVVSRRRSMRTCAAALRFAEFAPILHVSALTGQRAPRVIERAVDVAAARATHVGTAEAEPGGGPDHGAAPPGEPRPPRGEDPVRHAGRRAASLVRLLHERRRPGFIFRTSAICGTRLRDAFGFEGSPHKGQGPGPA